MKDIVVRPVTSEKAVRLMEAENTLTFIVEQKADKAKIKKAIQDLFKVTVIKLNTLNTRKNEKKAYARLSDKDNALDIGASMGMI